MIDVRRLTNNIIDANRAPVPDNVALGMAIRVTAEGLAACWDDCIGSKPGDPIRAANPYRLALQESPDAPFTSHDEPDDAEEQATNPRYADWGDVVVEAPLPPGHTRHQFVTTGDDEELSAIQIIVKALDGLDDPTQHRIIRYVSERIA